MAAASSHRLQAAGSVSRVQRESRPALKAGFWQLRSALVITTTTR
ncbi:hypothetical protein ACN28I_20275 [Archangium gephyra]